MQIAILQEIVPSCDCITVIVDTITLTSNQVNRLEVKFKSDSIESSFRKHIDIFLQRKRQSGTTCSLRISQIVIIYNFK
ncbi:MAG: DUF1573 domain-containing protein [Muribaculaceae bacterium]|nr:DUF1573 domain-containing protein [Muribaculaceae bacterium]